MIGRGHAVSRAQSPSAQPGAHGRRVLRYLAATVVVGILAGLPGLGVQVALAGPSLTAAAFVSAPVAVGGNHVCALPGDGSVRCWGDNSFGQLGDGEVTNPKAPAGDVQVIHVVAADATSTGGRDCRDIVADGSVIECHSSTSLAGVTAITAGFSHTCALLVDTTVRCWGSNAPINGGQFAPSYTGGELGDGTLKLRTTPTPVIAGAGQTSPLSGVASISAASGYTCAVLLDHTVSCWGNAPQGTGPAPIPVLAAAGQPLTQVASVAAGDRFACATLLDRRVVCWGEGLLGNNQPPTSGADHWPVTVVGAGTPAAELGGIASLALSHDVLNGPNGFAEGHSCALDDAGGVSCWGVNDVSQLGNGSNGLTEPDASRNYAGKVLAARGSTTPLTGAVAIAAGGYFTCALIDGGSVKCWGLGLGGSSFEGGGAPVPLDIVTAAADPGIVLAGFGAGSILKAARPLGGVVSIAAGNSTICAVQADGSLWCSGADYSMTAVPGVTITASSATPAPTPTPIAAASTPPTSNPTGPIGGAADIDGLAGMWNVIYGAPVTVSVRFADGTYSVTTTMPTPIAGTSCAVPAGTLMESFTGSGGDYRGQQALFGPTCQFAEFVPLTGHRDSNGAVTIVYAGAPGRHVLVPAGSPAGPSLFRNSIPIPSQINLDLATVVLPTLIAAVLIVVLVPFPGALFNSTLRTNYAELMRRRRRARRRIRNALLRPWFAVATRRSIASGPQPVAIGEEEPILSPPPAEAQRHDIWWTWPGVATFVLAIAGLTSLLDPSFWFDAASVPTFIGMLAGLVLIMVAFNVPSIIFYRRSNIRFWFRALPATLFVALVCLAISRLTEFHPGYLYGLVITMAVAANLGPKVEGKLLAAGVILTLAVAIVAWFALGVVAPVAKASTDPLLVGGQTVLSMLVSNGVQVTAFGLLPLSFLAGESVRKWNRWVHGSLWLFGVVAFGIVVLNPQNGYLSDTTRTPLITIVALLVLFSIGSVWFWRYFRDWHRRMAPSLTPAVEEAS
jgi:Regulator of Chromosome Condensation (RCC1) repeat protein